MSPRAARLGPPIICCRAWTDIPDTEREQWALQVLHQFSHSRTTFGLSTFAATARVLDKEAEQLIRDAEQRKWIWTPARGVWVGRLSTRR